MALSILQVTSGQPTRVTIALSGAVPLTQPADHTLPPAPAAADYSIARSTGAASGITVTLAFLRATNVAELCLDKPLLDGVEYTVTASGAGSAPVGYRSPETPIRSVNADLGDDDPEAAVFGRDVAWISASLDSAGRVNTRRGIAAWLKDSENVALTSPGELVHRPKAGAGLLEDVNGPTSLIDEARARLRSAWARDPRTAKTSVDAQPADDGGGEVTFDCTLYPIAIPGESYPLAVTR